MQGPSVPKAFVAHEASLAGLVLFTTFLELTAALCQGRTNARPQGLEVGQGGDLTVRVGVATGLISRRSVRLAPSAASGGREPCILEPSISVTNGETRLASSFRRAPVASPRA